MSEEQQFPAKKKRNWFITLAKVTFFVAAFILVILTVLANMGGKSDTLKDALEGVISESTGYMAHVGELNNMSFFPQMGVSFGSLELRETEGGVPVAVAEKGEVYFDFFDVMRGTGKVKALNIRDFRALPGAFMKKSLQIEYVEIVDLEGTEAELAGEGMIGEDKFKLRADLERDGERYGFGTKRAMEFEIGGIGISGLLEDVSRKHLSLQDFQMTLDGQNVLTGHMKALVDEVRVKMDGELLAAENGTKLVPDLSLNFKSDPPRIIGRVNSPAFYVADFEDSSRVAQFFNELDRIISDLSADKERDLSHLDVAIDVSFEDYLEGGASKGSLQFPVKIEHSKMTIGQNGKAIDAGDISLQAVIGEIRALKTPQESPETP